MKKITKFLEIKFENNLLKPINNIGADLWQSQTHQKIKVDKGVVDSRLLSKDAKEELGEELMKVIGSLIGREYRIFNWNKYKIY